MLEQINPKPGTDIAMPAALQAQLLVSESQAMEKPRGGALFGLWGMAGKLALALAAGIAVPLLALLSHPAGGLTQTQVLPWLYAGLPVMIKLLAVLALQRSQLMRSSALDAEPTGNAEQPRTATRWNALATSLIRPRPPASYSAGKPAGSPVRSYTWTAGSEPCGALIDRVEALNGHAEFRAGRPALGLTLAVA